MKVIDSESKTKYRKIVEGIHIRSRAPSLTSSMALIGDLKEGWRVCSHNSISDTNDLSFFS